MDDHINCYRLWSKRKNEGSDPAQRNCKQNDGH